MIRGPSDIAAMFSVMHDGGIAAWSGDFAGLRLRVEIEYLARRISSAFRYFEIELVHVRDLRFSTWPNDEAAPPRVVSDPDRIFHAELEILSAEVHGTGVRVICNQPSPNLDYCGGEMDFTVDCAVVRDEHQNVWSVSELSALADAYWSEWQRKSEENQRNAT